MADAVDKYLAGLTAWTGWEPPTVRGELERVAGRQAWAVRGIGVLEQAWRSLPGELRTQVLARLRDAAGDVISGATAGLGKYSNAFQNAGFSDAAGSAGVIVAVLAYFVESASKGIRGAQAAAERESQAWHLWKQAETLERYVQPTNWVADGMPVSLYPWYYKERSLWRAKPAFSVNTHWWGETFGLDIPDPSGWCDAGVDLIPSSTGDALFPDSDLTYATKSATENKCSGYVAISHLFFPWWKVDTLGPIPVPEDIEKAPPPQIPADFIARWGVTNCRDIGGGQQVCDWIPPNPNLLLVSRQLALLSDPATNLRAGGSRVRSAYFAAKARLRAAMRDAGIEVDASKVPGKEAAQDPTPDLFYDAEGFLQHYKGRDLAAIQLPAPNGGGVRLGLPLSAYNTARSAALGFFRARARFLADGPVMAQLLKDRPIEKYDSEARDAMKAAATRPAFIIVGAATAPPPPSGAPTFTLTAAPARAPLSTGAKVAIGIGAAVVVGGGVAGGVIWYRRRRRRARARA